ncbi:MAG: 2-C-methyl-D-erythritol 4-phosphate cytidylyltransferase [Proteobacteria bacterium]|nr:2-C-methyl-D-erythritol 4-phosphate cytidylyltransferase [Pseudomonadota bacterium]
MSYKSYYIILLASGVGKRAGLKNDTPKQLWLVNNKPILWYSLNTFRKIFKDEQIIITYSREYEKKFLHFFKKYNVKSKVVYGGERRQDSVKNAFSLIENEKGIVIIHDSARPIINLPLVKKVIEGTEKYGACIPIIPVSDTVKVIENGFVQKTIDRSKLGLVQTPQGFSIELLKKAFENADFSKEYTDEASLIEQLGKQVYTIQGEKFNLKLTFKEDLTIIKTLLRQYYEF